MNEININLDQFTEKTLVDANTGVIIALVYGLNAIAQAINPEKAETSMQLLERVWSQYSMNKQKIRYSEIED